MVEWGVGEDKVVEGWGIQVDAVEDQVHTKEEELEAAVLIHWHAIGVPCVAIWPMTVPPPATNRREVA